MRLTHTDTHLKLRLGESNEANFVWQGYSRFSLFFVQKLIIIVSKHAQNLTACCHRCLGVLSCVQMKGLFGISASHDQGWQQWIHRRVLSHHLRSRDEKYSPWRSTRMVVGDISFALPFPTRINPRWRSRSRLNYKHDLLSLLLIENIVTHCHM
jgi:hypothetical protein